MIPKGDWQPPQAFSSVSPEHEVTSSTTHPQSFADWIFGTPIHFCNPAMHESILGVTKVGD